MKTKISCYAGPGMGRMIFNKNALIAAIITIGLTGSSFNAIAQTSQTKATSAEMVGALHAAFGKHPNARAVHAKGLFFKGTFTPAAGAQALSVAPHLQNLSLNVIVRFSDFTGIPNISDTVGALKPARHRR
jgi:catalase